MTLSLKARSAIMLAGHGGDAVTWLSEHARRLAHVAASTRPAGAGGQGVHRRATRSTPTSARAGRGCCRPSAYSRPDDARRRSAAAGLDGDVSARAERAPAGTAGRDRSSRSGSAARSPTRTSDGSRRRSSSRSSSATHEGTDVLGVSFSSPDLVGHAFGPRSQEVQDIYAHLDRDDRRAVRRARRAVGKGRWVAGLSADHGVTPIPEQLVAEGKDAGRISGGAIIERVDQALIADARPGPARDRAQHATTCTSRRASTTGSRRTPAAIRRGRSRDRRAARASSACFAAKTCATRRKREAIRCCARRRSATSRAGAAI